jgi:ADP-heptose:LPS heptosyltransferase
MHLSIYPPDPTPGKRLPQPDGLTRFREALDAVPSGGTAQVWVRLPIQLGDMVMALPSMFIIKAIWERLARDRGVRLEFALTGRASVSMFKEAVPDVFAACLPDTEFPASSSPIKLLRHWKERAPLAVINYSKSDRIKVAAWLAGVPVRAGIADGSNNWCYHFSHPFMSYTQVGHRHFRYLPLTQWLAGPQASAPLPTLGGPGFGGTSVLSLLRDQGWDGGPYVVFGVYPLPQFPERRWYPLDEPWVRLAALARKAGVTPVLAGGPENRARLEHLGVQSGSVCLAGRTSLAELLALVANAMGTVTVDTGIAHMAALTGQPTVVIFSHGQEFWDFPCGPKVISLRGDPTGESVFPFPPGSMDRVTRPWAAVTSSIPPSRAWSVLNLLAAEG